ncbi:plasminogen-like [Uranotaenia lowii]|uniref:plasminogen-like n=1 Tax=Uranotaenia lowii TaxID=190385 RepID=UPI002479FF34|nr:plasminogen-like [Uranotaenia lowii]
MSRRILWCSEFIKKTGDRSCRRLMDIKLVSLSLANVQWLLVALLWIFSVIYGQPTGSNRQGSSSSGKTFDDTPIQTRPTRVDTFYDEWQSSSLTAGAVTIGSRELNCTACKCGNKETGAKIVGGMTAPENKYSWMAALYYNNKFICGGSLITDRYVITAAHCVFRTDPARFRIQFLVHNRTNPTSSSVERSVKSIKSFFYNILTNNNDLALLELMFPVNVGDQLVPICLPPANDKLYEGKMAVVTGWGKTAVGGLAATLQELPVPILTNTACRKAGYWGFQITNKMLCAGYLEGGRDSCQGDSGGPLQIFNNDTRRYELAGVVSWGRACAQKNYPGVYTRISKFLRWIGNKVKDSCICN